MIFPYAAPQLPSDCSRRALFEFSCCCIENARDLFIVLEAKYREHFARNLTLSRPLRGGYPAACPRQGKLHGL